MSVTKIVTLNDATKIKAQGYKYLTQITVLDSRSEMLPNQLKAKNHFTAVINWYENNSIKPIKYLYKLRAEITSNQIYVQFYKSFEFNHPAYPVSKALASIQADALYNLISQQKNDYESYINLLINSSASKNLKHKSLLASTYRRFANECKTHCDNYESLNWHHTNMYNHMHRDLSQTALDCRIKEFEIYRSEPKLLKNMSKSALLKKIMEMNDEMSVSEKNIYLIPLLEECLNETSHLGQRFWKQEGSMPCALSQGKLKEIRTLYKNIDRESYNTFIKTIKEDLSPTKRSRWNSLKGMFFAHFDDQNKNDSSEVIPLLNKILTSFN